MQEIIILVEEYLNNKESDMESVDVFADFRSERDYYTFSENIGLNTNNKATAFVIKGIKHSKQIAIGKYYTLNLDSIKKYYRLQNIEDSYLYGFELYLSSELPVPFEELFDKVQMDESDYYGGTAPSVIRNTIVHPIELTNNIIVTVNNVGQGNWNEVTCDGATRLVYDIGAPLRASIKEVNDIVNRIVPRYHNLSIKPTLLLSHWDKDHYHALLALKDSDFSIFDKYIFPGNPPTATAKRIYEKITNNNGKTIIVRPGHRDSGMPSLPEIIWEEQCYSIFIGQEHSDRNLSGIQVFLRSKHENILLCGDCGWYQVIHILAHKTKTASTGEKCNVVVPHHGGGKDKTYYGFTIPCFMNKGKALISVDKKKNSYGHPSKSLMDYLDTCFNDILRTDIEQADITVILA